MLINKLLKLGFFRIEVVQVFFHLHTLFHLHLDVRLNFGFILEFIDDQLVLFFTAFQRLRQLGVYELNVLWDLFEDKGHILAVRDTLPIFVVLHRLKILLDFAP